MANVELTPSQVRELTAIDQAILVIQNDLARARRAGLDTGDLETRLANANSKRIGLLREFTPGRTGR